VFETILVAFILATILLDATPKAFCNAIGQNRLSKRSGLAVKLRCLRPVQQPSLFYVTVGGTATTNDERRFERRTAIRQGSA
jgi:hypothetical protein